MIYIVTDDVITCVNRVQTRTGYRTCGAQVLLSSDSGQCPVCGGMVW